MAGILEIFDHTLYKAILSRLNDNAPILCHVNADTSWLILIPLPVSEQAETDRIYLKVLIDPWFTGPQVDYFVWFSVQHHVIPSSVETVAELETILQQVEIEEARLLARQTSSDSSQISEAKQVDNTLGSPNKSATSREHPIDAVVVSHEFTDHCHRETLIQLPPSTAIVASTAAAKLIASWQHFRGGSLHKMPNFTSCIEQAQAATISRTFLASASKKTDKTDTAIHWQWKQSTYSSLPKWLSISRLLSPRDIPQKGFHAGVLVAFKGILDSEHSCRAIIYTPHGMTCGAVAPLMDTKLVPRIKPLALLQGIVKVDLARGLMPLNLGGGEAEKVARLLAVPYWFGTHEEDKQAGGGVARILRRKTIPVGGKEDMNEGSTASANRPRLQADFHELGSGQVAALA